MEKIQTTFPVNIQKVLTPYAKNKNKNKKTRVQPACSDSILTLTSVCNVKSYLPHGFNHNPLLWEFL